MKFTLFVVLSLLFCSDRSNAQTDTVDINISLNGAQVPNASSGIGSELGTGSSGCFYKNTTNQLTIKIQFSGLSGTVTAAHIHGPAAAGVNAGVVVGFGDFPTGVTSGTYTKTVTLTDVQEADLLADKHYINIHTTTFGGGEIRGQLINGGLLPVELTSFIALVRGKSVDLVWKTATEVNNAGFEIQRSVVGGEWTKVGFVEGNGTTNAPKSYSFTDASAKGTVSYRLKQIDRDGQFEYSSVVNATVAMTAADYELSQNFPNPFNPNTNITFAMKNSENVNVTVYNALGQVVATLFNDIANANQVYTLSFDGKNLSSGTYFYALRSASRNEVRKMSLMK